MEHPGGVSPSDDPLPTAGSPQWPSAIGRKKGIGLLYFMHRLPKGVHWALVDPQLKKHRCAVSNGDVAASALAEHVLMAGHGIDLSKTEILDSNPYTTTQSMLESWHIQHNENKLNREWGNLPEVYTALLEWSFTLIDITFGHPHITLTLFTSYPPVLPCISSYNIHTPFPPFILILIFY